jgi:cullin 3
VAERRGAQGAHLRATGKALVEDPERTKDPVDFVQRLLAEKDKYDRRAPDGVG